MYGGKDLLSIRNNIIQLVQNEMASRDMWEKVDKRHQPQVMYFDRVDKTGKPKKGQKCMLETREQCKDMLKDAGFMLTTQR